MSRNYDMTVPDIDMFGMYEEADVVSTRTNGDDSSTVTYSDPNDVLADDDNTFGTFEPINENDYIASNDFYVKELKEITDDFATQEASKKAKVEEFKEQIDNKNKPSEIEVPQEAVEMAFDFIKENGLLYIPEGVELTLETLNDIVIHDQELRNQAALEYIKDQAGDEYVAELFELVFNGGTIDDLENGKKIISDEKFFKELDVTKEDNQRKIIREYLKEGLDSTKPSYKLHLDRVEKEVDSIIDSYLGKEKAEEAVAYFLDAIEQDKIAVQQDIRHRQEQEALAMQKRQEYADKWQKDFIGSLIEREWSKDKKDEVLKQLSRVNLDNGEQVQLYKFKLDRILESPTHSQMLMQFLTNFDEYKLEFKGQIDSPTKLATSKILEIAKKKTSTSSSSKDPAKFYSDEAPTGVFESK